MNRNRPVGTAAAIQVRDKLMFDLHKPRFPFPAPRHLRLAVALAALALAPGMVSALDIPGVGGVNIGRSGVGVNLLGDRGINANVNTGNGVGLGASVGGDNGVNANATVGGSQGGVNADASVGGDSGVSATAGVGGQGADVGVSLGGSNGLNADVGVGTGGVNVGVGTGSGNGGTDPGGTDPGGTDPGDTNPGNGGDGGTGSGIIITDFDALPQARLTIPATCARAGNYDLLIGVPVMTSANQLIGAVAGAYVEGGVLTRLRVAVDPAYVPPGGCVEITNLAGGRAGVDGLVLNVSMVSIQGALR